MKMNSPDEAFTIGSVGPAPQFTYPFSIHGLAATIPAGNNINSNIIKSEGNKFISVGLISSQAGVLSIQGYLDEAGIIPQGAPVTATLVAATANLVNYSPAAIFQSFKINVTNTGGSPANLTSVNIVVQTS